MRTLHITIALAVLAIAFVIDNDSRSEANFGYFVVVAAALLASALLRTEGDSGPRNRRVALISEALAKGPLTLAELREALGMTGLVHEADAVKYEEVVGALLESAYLKISGGAIGLAGENESR